MPQTFNVGSRSLFVTLTAWAFIVLAAAATACALVQNAMVDSLTMAHLGTLPFGVGLLMAYLPWVMGSSLFISVATLATAIGLLLRMEWARRVFIGLLALAIVGNLAGLWLQQELMLAVADQTLARVRLPQPAAEVFGGFVVGARVMAGMLTLAGCALLGWIAQRLMSPSVRQEFA
ncbi:MAG: hypothetical protein HY021_02810 [Burkholderiales bacterium]|nr:hypothetical protein [Burkholderiales bacterium]